ncbi:hypothetical protein HDU96_010088 [Phlyctochytrium bullatum]|nr:hypothetical protein HDU96_010088 [Phlyctochytrium bullatum]
MREKSPGTDRPARRTRRGPTCAGPAEYTALMACQPSEAASALLEAVERHVPHVMHDLLVAQCCWKNTALHWAIDDIEEKDRKLFGVLLKAIEKIEGGQAIKMAMLAARGSMNETVLCKACKAGDRIAMVVLGAMFDGAHPRTFEDMRKVLLIVDDEGFTPVHAAAKFGHEEALRKLFEVMLAVDDGMCKKVLEMKGGNEAFRRTPLQGTPLHFVAWNGSFSCVWMLLEHGADPEARDGSDALELPERMYQDSVVEVL